MGKQGTLFPQERVYCIDSSALINLLRYPGYPREIFPTIWQKLEEMVSNRTLISAIEVYREIENTQHENDPILEWCKQNKHMFRDIDECQLEVLPRIERQYEPHYWENETSKEGPWADPWVIALSICEGAIIVADEACGRNRMPDIAKRLGREYMNLLTFFARTGVKY